MKSRVVMRPWRDRAFTVQVRKRFWTRWRDVAEHGQSDDAIKHAASFGQEDVIWPPEPRTREIEG